MWIIGNVGKRSGADPLTAEAVRRICVFLADEHKRTSFVYRGIGMDRYTWSKIMSGKRNITLRELVAIAELLGVTPNDLLPINKPVSTEPKKLDKETRKKIMALLDGEPEN
jgi:DNA-binding Xre family transcriptional regulator